MKAELDKKLRQAIGEMRACLQGEGFQESDIEGYLAQAVAKTPAAYSLTKPANKIRLFKLTAGPIKIALLAENETTALINGAYLSKELARFQVGSAARDLEIEIKEIRPTEVEPDRSEVNRCPNCGTRDEGIPLLHEKPENIERAMDDLHMSLLKASDRYICGRCGHVDHPGNFIQEKTSSDEADDIASEYETYHEF